MSLSEEKSSEENVSEFSADAESNKENETTSSKKKPHSFSIYCFNRMWIEKTYKAHLPKDIAKLYEKDGGDFGKTVEIQEAVWNYVKNHSVSFPEVKKESIFNSVINMTPFYMNVRLDRQKGTFLMPTNPYSTFEENLKSLVEKDPDGKYRVLKINVEYNNDMLLYYQKFLDEMNINHAVLFNDVENICKQINYKTSLPNDALVVSKSRSLNS